MSKEVRPVLQIPKTRYDQVLEYGAIALLTGLWALTDTWAAYDGPCPSIAPIFVARNLYFTWAHTCFFSHLLLARQQ